MQSYKKKDSTTDYITKISLKNYPINLYEFPGFKTTNDINRNNSCSLGELKNIIYNLKNNKEIIHCNIFCINYTKWIDERDLKEVFEILAKTKIRTFFIITESKNEVSAQSIKKIIIKNLNILRTNYNDFNKIFGNDLNKSIIPVLSRDKIINRFTTFRAFGLDNLFRRLYEYFSKKRIDLNKEIIFNNEKMKECIENNELLRGIDT